MLTQNGTPDNLSEGEQIVKWWSLVTVICRPATRLW